MKNEFVTEVIQFNRNVIGVKDHPICMLSKPEVTFTVKALEEEATELSEAYELGDMLGCVDALIDIQVFAIGAMYKMGLSHDKIVQCMAAVCEANAAKKGGTLNKERSQPGVTDAVKPADWVAPEERISQILDLD